MPVPRVSVILPTLNRAALLPRAIGSVLGQTFRDLELLVVDDGSSEDIVAVVAAFGDARARVIRHQRCLGVSAARNTGLHEARGDYVAFQDSDDEWRLDKLEQQLQQMDAAGSDVGLVICGMLRQRLDGRLWCFPEPAIAQAYSQSSREAVRHFAVAFTQTWLVRRRLLVDEEIFEPALRVWEDWDLLLRLNQRTRIQLCETPLVISYVTAASLSADAPQRVVALSHLIKRWQSEGNTEFISRLHYLKARYQVIARDHQGLWSGLYAALRAQPANLKAWILAALLLTGTWLPRRYLSWRQPAH